MQLREALQTSSYDAALLEQASRFFVVGPDEDPGTYYVSIGVLGMPSTRLEHCRDLGQVERLVAGEVAPQEEAGWLPVGEEGEVQRAAGAHCASCGDLIEAGVYPVVCRDCGHTVGTCCAAMRAPYAQIASLEEEDGLGAYEDQCCDCALKEAVRRDAEATRLIGERHPAQTDVWLLAAFFVFGFASGVVSAVFALNAVLAYVHP